MTLAPWTDTELDRMVAEADRREAAHRAAEEKRRAALLRRYEPKHRIAPQSWVFALNGIAGLLFIATGALAYAGLLAGL